MVAVDPSSSLGILDIELTIGGRDYTLAGRPAADWLDTVLSGGMSSVIPGWLGDDAEAEILDRLYEDEIDSTELNNVTLDVLSVACGRPWWWAMHLIRYATEDVHHWSRINGRLVLAGVDPRRISLSAWVDAVYCIVTENLDLGSDEHKNFLAAIDTPPAAELLDEEAEAEAFLSMMG